MQLSVASLLLGVSYLTFSTYPGCLSMVMTLRRTRTSNRHAVAIVTRVRNETRLRLLLQRPDRLFDRLTSRSPGSLNQDLVRGSVTSHAWVAIDSDYDNGLYYVIDRKARSITVIDQETNQISNIHTGTSSKAMALAVNWEENAVYWSDAAYDAIFRYRGTDACRLEGCVRTVIGTGLDNPTGLAVHPYRRFLYWIDVRGALGKLERSDLNGRGRKLLFEQLSMPSAVAIDYNNDRLYWLEQSGSTSVVGASDLEGGNRYSAAVLSNTRAQDLDVYRGLLLMTEPRRGDFVMHDVIANVTRTLSVGQPSGVCVFSPGVRRTVEQSPLVDRSEGKDIVEEGILVLVSDQGRLSVLEKTAMTATREETPRQIIFRDSVTAVAADVRKRHLYFYDRSHKAIERMSLRFLSPETASEPEIKIITKAPRSVSGIAVDWLTETIYWTDNGFKRVAAISADGSHVRCMACRDVQQPRAIVVHPIKTLLFWTDVDPSNPRIERINVTDMRRTVIMTLVDAPQALTIDFKTDLLYWTEGPRLCRSDLDGRGSGTCPFPPGHTPLAIKSMDIVHDFIVWTDSIREGIYVSDKENNFDSLFSQNRVLASDTLYSDVMYFHPSRQPKYNNSCTANNGGCAHFCIPAPSGTPACACATGYWSRRNGSCISGFVEDHFVLVTDSVLGGIYQQYQYLPDYYVISVRHLRQPSDAKFDKINRKLYWSDVHTGMVSRSDLDGRRQEVVFAHSHIAVDKFHLDEEHQLLFFIDVSRESVGVISLDTMKYKIVLHTFQFNFNDIAVNTLNGDIYLSASPSQSGQTYVTNDVMSHTMHSILRCNVDGDTLTEILTADGQVRGLEISSGVLYWVNAASRTLNAYHLTAGNTSQITELPHWANPNDVTVLDEYLYFTDFDEPTLHRYKLTEPTDGVEMQGDPVLYAISSITSVHMQSTQGDCLYDTGVHQSTASPSRDPCRHSNAISEDCLSVQSALEAVRIRKGLCKVPEVLHGRVLTVRSGAYVMTGDVITIECQPGYGDARNLSRHFTSICQNTLWLDHPECIWAQSYNISGSTSAGFYVVLTSSTDFVIPEGVTHVDVIAIGGGGGGMHACNAHFPDVTRAGRGGASRFGRYLRAGGGVGGTMHEGGRGGFGTVYFGGSGELSSLCLGGGAAGQTTWSRPCRLGSAVCPFCGAGGAPEGCSLCHERSGGCRGPWALQGQGISADSFGGGGTGRSGGGGGGGGGYSRRIVDVTPGETIPVTVGREGRPSAGRAGGGVVVVGWGGRLEDVLPRPDPLPLTCRPFSWTPNAVGSEPSNDWERCGDQGFWEV